MPFYKSRNATISERLTGISNKDGFDAARKLVKSKRMGVGQKEADSWSRMELVKLNVLTLIKVTVGTFSGIATVFEFFSK